MGVLLFVCSVCFCLVCSFVVFLRKKCLSLTAECQDASSTGRQNLTEVLSLLYICFCCSVYSFLPRQTYKAFFFFKTSHTEACNSLLLTYKEVIGIYINSYVLLRQSVLVLLLNCLHSFPFFLL